LAINFPDLQDSPRDLIHADRLAEYRHKRDYVRSATNVLRREGLHIKQGYDCTIHGTIPINAGTSSSSALVVAWTAFLLATQNGDLPHEREDIARFAHKAEVVEFEEAGGMMDHYASAVGGLLHIDCREPITVTRLPAHLDGFVLGDSGIPKNTVGTLRASRDDTRAGLSILKSHIPDFSLQSTSLEQAEEYFPLMPENVRRRVRANFINRDICREARELLSQPVVEDTARLGRLLYEHQAQLRDGIGVSHPKLDEMLDAAMEAGALGGKLNGSGCGGCMFAYAPGRQQEVKEALERVGNRAFIISMSDGVQVQRD
jgi:galactokinase